MKPRQSSRHIKPRAYHIHGDREPWAGAHPWAIELVYRLSIIESMLEIIMSLETEALDELEKSTTAIDGIGDSAEAAFLRLAAMIEALKTQSTDPATAQRITAAAEALKSRAARLAAAIEATPQ